MAVHTSGQFDETLLTILNSHLTIVAPFGNRAVETIYLSATCQKLI